MKAAPPAPSTRPDTARLRETAKAFIYDSAQRDWINAAADFIDSLPDAAALPAAAPPPDGDGGRWPKNIGQARIELAEAVEALLLAWPDDRSVTGAAQDFVLDFLGSAAVPSTPQPRALDVTALPEWEALEGAIAIYGVAMNPIARAGRDLVAAVRTAANQ